MMPGNSVQVCALEAIAAAQARENRRLTGSKWSSVAQLHMVLPNRIL
jgi:hypothetical protein